MNYKELSNDELYNYICLVIKRKNYNEWIDIINNQELINRVKEDLNNSCFKKYQIVMAKRFLIVVEDLKAFLKLKNMLSNPLIYPDRKKLIYIIKNIEKYSKNFFAKMLPKEDKILLDNICSSQTISTNNIEYNIDLINSLINLLNTEDSIEDKMIKTHDNLGIKPEYISNLYNSYISALLSDSDSNLLSLSYEDILKIKSFELQYKEYYHSKKTDKEKNIDSELINETFILCTTIESFISIENDYNKLIEFLLNKGYTYKLLEAINETFDSLWSIYTNPDLKTNILFDSSDIKLSDRRKYKELLSKTLETYNYLLNSSYLIEIICSNRPDKDYIIDLSIRLKYFNGFKNCKVEEIFNKEHIKKLGEKEQQELANYLSRYETYYYSRKQKEKDEETNVAIKKEQDNIEEYAKYVRDLLAVKPDSIPMYLQSIKVSDSKFSRILEILKRENHPIYQEYVNYCEGQEKRVINKIGNILEKIRDGVVENGKERPFDLVDYYESTTLSPSLFMRLAQKNYPISSLLSKMGQFFDKYKNDVVLGRVSIENILKQDIRFLIPTEDDKKYVYEVTLEDKNRIFELLNQYNIPVTHHTYRILLKRYVYTRYEFNKPITSLETVKAKQKEIQ